MVQRALVLLLALWAGPAFAQAPSIEECDTRVRESPADPGSYYCFVEAANASGRFDEAASHLEQIRLQHPERQRATLCLASIRHSQDRPETEALYRDAIVLNVAAGDTWGEVYARSGLGQWLVNQGRLDPADTELELARVAAETLNDNSMLANVLSRQAAIAYARLDYGRAFAIYREAESLVFPEGPTYLQSWVLSGLGSVYWAFGDYRQAMALYEREAEVARLSGDLFTAASVRWNMAFMGSYLQARHETTEDEVQELLNVALQAAIEGNNPFVEASCRAGIGQRLQGTEAVEELEQALALSSSVEVTMLVRRYLARATFELGPAHRDDGLRILDAVIREAEEQGRVFDIARGQVMRAALVRDFWPEQEAIQAGQESLAAVEDVRTRQPDSQTRALVFSQWGNAYASFVDWLFASLDRSADPEHALELALATMERMRGRILLEHLEAVGEAQHDLEIPQLTALKQTLAPDQMLLSYQLWERGRGARPGQDRSGGSWLMAITRDDTRIIEIPGAHRLSQQVAIFEGLLEGRDNAERAVAGHLYADLLGEALSGPGAAVRRLVIVPDGPLHSLPFAALRPSSDERSLAETHVLSYAPSVAVWMRWATQTNPLALGDGVLSLADPDLPKAHGSRLRAANPWTGEAWYGALPHARREAQALVRYIGAGQIRSGAEATETWLKQIDLAPFAVLHFAAHAMVDTDRPERNAVLLSPGSEEEDGLLQMQEIIELDLSGRLVILSSCRSATGSVVAGEGVMGLAHAFFRAGARTIIGSLWPLKDVEAADLVEEIAHGLAKGLSVDHALARAQELAIHDGAPAEAWAGMVVLGDGDLRFRDPGSTPLAVWWLAGLVGVAILLFLVVRRS